MKYKLFRSPGDLDKAVRKHELVAVETGKSIDDVADALIRAVRDDLAEMPEYAHCETAAYVPVSYTHLDVYKRQVFEDDFDCMVFVNQNAVNKGHQHTAVQLFDVFKMCIRDRNRTGRALVGQFYLADKRIIDFDFLSA